MLDIGIRDDEEQARTTSLQDHVTDLRANATGFREGEKERHDQG
jgi:hypothetical protein